MKRALLARVFLLAAIAGQATVIRCDVDGRIEHITGEHGYSANYLECPSRHVICDRHVVFAKNGHVMCPVDGWVRP